MLNAAEASIEMAAEDDAERARNRARLYAPPEGSPRRSNRSAGMTVDRARALAEQLAAEDAKFAAGRTRFVDLRRPRPTG